MKLIENVRSAAFASFAVANLSAYFTDFLLRFENLCQSNLYAMRNRDDDCPPRTVVAFRFLYIRQCLLQADARVIFSLSWTVTRKVATQLFCWDL